MNRAARRQAKRRASEIVAALAQGGFGKRTAAGGVVRVTEPAAVRCRRQLAERAIRADGKPVVAALREPAAARALVPEIPDGAVAYVAGAFDHDGRFAWTADWVGRHRDRRRERSIATTILLPRLDTWRGTPGFGHLDPAGSA